MVSDSRRSQMTMIDWHRPTGMQQQPMRAERPSSGEAYPGCCCCCCCCDVYTGKAARAIVGRSATGALLHHHRPHLPAFPLLPSPQPPAALLLRAACGVVQCGAALPGEAMDVGAFERSRQRPAKHDPERGVAARADPSALESSSASANLGFGGGVAVCTVPDAAFLGRAELRSLSACILPPTARAIGQFAFYGCSGLSGALELPPDLVAIGRSAFQGCSGVSGELRLPASLVTVGDAAFSGCRELAAVYLSDGLATIENHSFFGCSSLRRVRFPPALAAIEAHAFRGCAGLEGDLRLPSSVTGVAPGAFAGCAGIRSVRLSRVFANRQLASEAVKWLALAAPAASRIAEHLLPLQMGGAVTVTRTWAMHPAIPDAHSFPAIAGSDGAELVVVLATLSGDVFPVRGLFAGRVPSSPPASPNRSLGTLAVAQHPAALGALAGPWKLALPGLDHDGAGAGDDANGLAVHATNDDTEYGLIDPSTLTPAVAFPYLLCGALYPDAVLIVWE